MDLNLKAGIIKNSNGENISPVTSSDTVYIKDTTLTEKFNNIIGREYTGSTNGEIFNDYENNIASGKQSHAEGSNTTSSSWASHAEGYKTTASGTNSHSEGQSTVANGDQSHAEGLKTKASGSCSHAEGFNTTASGSYSHAEGLRTKASGSCSHAEGANTIASGNYSHAEGLNTIASGDFSHAGGYYSYAGGFWGSFSYGNGCVADPRDTVLFVSSYSGSTITIDTSGEKISTSKTAEILAKFKVGQEILISHKGNSNKIYSKKIINSINIENSTITVDSNISYSCNYIINPSIQRTDITDFQPSIALGSSCVSIGSASFTEGVLATASGYCSHAEGNNTKANGSCSHSEGSNTTASGNYSHTEGHSTTASGDYSHAEGYYSTASGDYSHAEGYYSTASGGYSHAEGYYSTASGGYSHAEGYYSTASGDYSHAGGCSSYAGGNYGSFAHGNGCIADSQDTVLFVSRYSGSTITIDTSGKKLSTSKTSTILSKFEVGQEILILDTYYVNNQIGTKRIIKSIDTENSTITVDKDLPSSKFKCYCIINPSIKDGTKYYPNTAFGTACVSVGNHSSFAEGYRSTASGNFSHAEGNNTIASGSHSHAEGEGTIANGSYSHAEGGSTIANGPYSHAEGCSTTASGSQSHAEGYYSTASGDYSHAEGFYSTASGDYSHAEGFYSTASGNHSHAGGYSTTADRTFMTSIGKYNKTGVDSYFSIGKGTSSSATSNAFRVSSTGAVYGSSAYNSSGADYAEYMEWLDNNINKEDRTGLFVEVKQGKIQIANSYSRRLAGVISSTPSVVGNSYDDQWHDMYLKDEWDRIMYHDVTIPAEYQEIEHIDEETQEVTIEKVLITEEHIERQPVVNPEYDHTLEYIGRSERPEYGCVGMKGQLLVKSDGTCEVDDFCIPTTGGIATKSEDESIGYLVLEVRENNIIKILL